MGCAFIGTNPEALISGSHQSEAVCRPLGFVTIRHHNVFMPIAHDSLLYSRVETVLASEIADGDLKVGDRLPTEDSLIARFGVSRITVRRAVQNLVSRGLVEIRRGKGTFVAAPKITRELTELSGFVEDMHALGRKEAFSLCDSERIKVLSSNRIDDLSSHSKVVHHRALCPLWNGATVINDAKIIVALI